MGTKYVIRLYEAINLKLKLIENYIMEALIKHTPCIVQVLITFLLRICRVLILGAILAIDAINFILTAFLPVTLIGLLMLTFASSSSPNTLKLWIAWIFIAIPTVYWTIVGSVFVFQQVMKDLECKKFQCPTSCLIPSKHKMYHVTGQECPCSKGEE